MAGLSEIQAVTWENREKKPADAVSDNVALLYMLRKKGNVKTINGGRVIWEDIRYAQNAYVQNIDPTEEIAIGYNQTITGFEYSPKIIVVPVVVNALEKAQNEGDAQFLDLLEQRNQVAEDSLINAVESQLQGAGTGHGGKDLAGIASYCGTTGALTIGGLSQSSYSSIVNTYVPATSTFTGATDSSNIESRLRYCKNKVVRNSSKPGFCLAGDTYFNAACDAMSAKQRFTQSPDLVEANFDNVVIEGMSMVLATGKVFSGLSRIAVDRCYGINLDTVALKMYKNYNFQPVQDRVSVNQLVDISIMVGIGQFTTNNPALNFVLYDS